MLPNKCIKCLEVPKLSKPTDGIAVRTTWIFSCSCGVDRTFFICGQETEEDAIMEYNRFERIFDSKLEIK